MLTRPTVCLSSLNFANTDNSLFFSGIRKVANYFQNSFTNEKGTIYCPKPKTTLFLQKYILQFFWFEQY